MPNMILALAYLIDDRRKDQRDMGKKRREIQNTGVSSCMVAYAVILCHGALSRGLMVSLRFHNLSDATSEKKFMH